MNLCSSGHEEICYEERRRCPMCAQKEEHKAEVIDLENKIDELKDRVSELESSE